MITSAVMLGVLSLGLGNPGRVDATPSQYRHNMSGTVQRMDRQTITILSTGTSKPQAFSWNAKETEFFRDGAPTTVESLRVGTYVQIRCSHPLFGSGPLLYRVSWQTGTSRKK